MGRLLVFLLLAVLVLWLMRRALAGGARGAAGQGEARPGELVRCAQCGVHVPANEARLQGDRVYCSEEHARLGPREG